MYVADESIAKKLIKNERKWFLDFDVKRSVNKMRIIAETNTLSYPLLQKIHCEWE
jgi:hypothetical protein